METRDKSRANRIIKEILNSFAMEAYDDVNRQKIAYQIKCSLEREEINYETINLYTSPERVDQQLIDIRVDNELYPFVKAVKKNWFKSFIKWITFR